MQENISAENGGKKTFSDKNKVRAHKLAHPRRPQPCKFGAAVWLKKQESLVRLTHTWRIPLLKIPYPTVRVYFW